jgi:hypothetical protein
MTIDVLNMFFRSPIEKKNCEAFAEFCDKNNLNRFIMSASTANWQFDMKFDNGAVVSFWPHKLRAVDQRAYKTYDFTSWDEAMKLINAVSE